MGRQCWRCGAWNSLEVVQHEAAGQQHGGWVGDVPVSNAFARVPSGLEDKRAEPSF